MFDLLGFAGWHSSGYGVGHGNIYSSSECGDGYGYGYSDGLGHGYGPFIADDGAGYNLADGWQHAFADRHLFIGLITEPAPQYGFGEKNDVVLLGV
jgi:hypothetical protein